MKDYNGKLRVVFKNMVVHPPQVATAHAAGCAAGKQGKFVAFKNAFWEKAYGPYQANRDQSKLGEENIMAIAKELGLDTAKLKADMTGECQQFVQNDMQELQKFHVNGTPSFFINGKHFGGGAAPKEEFKKIIDERLKVAEASGVSGAEYYDKEIVGKGEKQFRSKGDPKPN